MRSINWALAVLVAGGLAALPAFAQQPPSALGPQSRFVVVLDAAHGGDDPGARLGSGQPEKALTLVLSVKLRSLLAARGIQVVTTRESDATVDSNNRAETANHAAAQACLILHASESGSGVHLFASSLAPAPPTHFGAWKTAQAGSVTRSLALAGALNSALQRSGIQVTLGRTALPTMDSMTCPAVALEIAPERDGQKLVAGLDNAGYQTRLVRALADALLEWRSEAH
jgi:N-acetylmuramoyl-L-alanine amidase